MADDNPKNTKRPREPHETEMTLGEHLDELRSSLIWALIGLVLGTGVSLVFTFQLLELLKAPFLRAVEESGAQASLVVTEHAAGFLTYMRVALISGLILSAPWIFYQLWRFVSSGLYPNERRSVLLAVPFSSLLFVAGALTFLFFLSYPTLYFFLSFNRWMGLSPMIKLDSHIAFMTNLMLVFGLGFQTPMVQYILARTGLVKARQFAKYRRHTVVILLVAAALLTSPSPIDQVGLAVPMYLLFEAGILLARFAERQRRNQQRREQTHEAS
jgi:sec-independent protein translocase protein TatC